MPHSYQQLLSTEKTPSLCGTIPAFEGLIQVLQTFQEDNPSSFNIIQPGIEKLQDYQEETAFAPAYTIATCKFLIFKIIVANNYYSAQSINKSKLVQELYI
jgi:hypothetical protein